MTKSEDERPRLTDAEILTLKHVAKSEQELQGFLATLRRWQSRGKLLAFFATLIAAGFYAWFKIPPSAP